MFKQGPFEAVSTGRESLASSLPTHPTRPLLASVESNDVLERDCRFAQWWNVKLSSTKASSMDAIPLNV